jgi:predicted PurR-regulated permease PerM
VLVLAAGLVLACVGFALLVVPPLVSQATGLADDVPRYLTRLAQRTDVIGDFVRREQVVAKVQSFVQTLPDRVGSSFDTVLGIAGRVGSLVFQVVTVLVLTIYFMLSMPAIRRSAALLIPPDRRARGEGSIDRAIERVGGYVVGNAVTSAFCGVFTLIALLIVGVPFAVPLALWAAAADLIPLIGAYLGAAPAIVVAFFVSPVAGLVVLVFFVVYQQCENYLLAPRVMMNAIDLSPAAVILATLIGGSLAGFAGALLALPAAATLKVLVTDLWLRNRSEAGDHLATSRYLRERRSQLARRSKEGSR